MCVCAREREREREIGHGGKECRHGFNMGVKTAMFTDLEADLPTPPRLIADSVFSLHVRVCVCTKQKKERKCLTLTSSPALQFLWRSRLCGCSESAPLPVCLVIAVSEWPEFAQEQENRSRGLSYNISCPLTLSSLLLSSQSILSSLLLCWRHTAPVALTHTAGRFRHLHVTASDFLIQKPRFHLHVLIYLYYMLSHFAWCLYYRDIGWDLKNKKTNKRKKDATYLFWIIYLQTFSNKTGSFWMIYLYFLRFICHRNLYNSTWTKSLCFEKRKKKPFTLLNSSRKELHERWTWIVASNINYF